MDDITSIFNKPKIQEYNTLIKSNSNGSKMEPLKKFNNKEDQLEDIIISKPKNLYVNKNYIKETSVNVVEVNNMSDLLNNICDKCQFNLVNCNCNEYVKGEVVIPTDVLESEQAEVVVDKPIEETIEIITQQELEEYNACPDCTNHGYYEDCACEQCQEVFNKHWINNKGKFVQNKFNTWYDNLMNGKSECSECHFCKYPLCYDNPNNYEEAEDGGLSTD